MRSLVSSAYGNFRFIGSGMKITCNFESLPYGVGIMAGRIGARPSAEPGVALLAPATSSTPWPRNTTLHSAAEEKPTHARGLQRTAALDARQAALADASMP